MKKTRIPSQPLKKIALSCSGGGYRAASFHLGTMSYLNRLQFQGNPLLENVEMLSTVSGGTITGVVYALLKKDKRTFGEIFNFLLDKLETLDLVKTGIEKLNPDQDLKNPDKTKNLINAFAEEYDAYFTNGKVMQDLAGIGSSHLKEVVFNSTEFKNAINFRFKNPDTSGYGGNFRARIPKKQLQEIKLSDVMAASSCFPAGFEPMLWPDDFVHNDAVNLKILKEKNTTQAIDPIGVMDGGIYDNQGIESILNYQKGSELPYFDLVIISDVASPSIKAYKPLEKKDKKGFRQFTLKKLREKFAAICKRINYILSGLLLFLLLLPFLWSYSNNIGTGLCLGLSVMVSLLILSKFLLLRQIRKTESYLTGKITEIIPPFYQEKIKALKIEELSVHRLEPLLINRLRSLGTLLLNVFLKVVRSLNYNRLYDDNRYEYRRISTLIKDLTRKDLRKKETKTDENQSQEATVNPGFLSGNYDSVIGKKIEKVIDEASGFGTTLWFTDQQKVGKLLEKLVAAGQLTMCYNMIRYLEKLIFTPENGFTDLTTDLQTDIRKLYEDCKKDWLHFKQDPVFLYNEGRRNPH